MSILLSILTTVAFIGAVVGLTHVLSASTKNDADRWLADRRILERRKQDLGAEDNLSERREGERRHPEGSSTRL